MVSQSAVSVGGNGGCFVFEAAELDQLPAYRDLCDPTLVTLAVVDPFVPRCIAAMSLYVCSVLSLSCLAQIVDPIVRLHAIPVVNCPFWPSTMNVQPRKAVGTVVPLLDGDLHVAVRGYPPSN